MSDLSLTKKKADFLDYILKEKHLLESGTTIYHNKTRDDVVYCHDIDSLINEFGIVYKKEDEKGGLDII